MSRIGKLPITIPAGVTVKIDGSTVSVKGPKGELKEIIADSAITAKIEGSEIIMSRATEQKRHKSMHGLYRVLISNMITGVSEGFSTELQLVGVGYRAANVGQVLELQLGYSHPIMFVLPKEVALTTEMPKGEAPKVMLQSIDKQLLGQVAAKIRSFRKPEPYKGKGIRFKGEIVRRKAGKTASK
jgi:large subunit ribosomal protein L6